MKGASLMAQGANKKGLIDYGFIKNLCIIGTTSIFCFDDVLCDCSTYFLIVIDVEL